jgi:nucleoside-diphosphate-sugar epimerase
MAKVTVTGGTGVLGRAVAPRLQADGHQVTVRPAARRRGCLTAPSGRSATWPGGLA